MINGYYNRFNPSKDYDRHLFRSGYVLQSAELNEIQSSMATKLRGVGDALFKDGDVIRDARIVVDPTTGATIAESGAVYVAGAVRGVAPANFTVPVVGVVRVGVYVVETVITALEDPELRDPAAGVRNYQEEGAARMMVKANWGFDGDNQAGEFYAVYYVDNGVTRSKEPPPQLDSVTQAIARYDRDNSGGTYVVSGMSVSGSPTDADGNEVLLIAEGRARVNGFSVELATSRRVLYPATPDLYLIDSEPHVSTNATSMRVNIDRAPVSSIDAVRITAEKTVTVTHGSFSGAADLLPDSSVIQVLEVKQNTTTYTATADYKFQAGAVDWSPSGVEPATGSTYTVKYRYITAATPTAVDSDGFTVAGAVVDSLILVTYKTKLPRIDLLVVNSDGGFEFVHGSATLYAPTAPEVPSGKLALATIYQVWRGDPTVRTTGIRVVSMTELQHMNDRMDAIVDLIAQNRLVTDISNRDASLSKGLFTDPFTNDTRRDVGITQNAVIFGGELTLPVTVSVARPDSDVKGVTTPLFTHEVFLEQPMRTGTMPVNPYQAFDPIPAAITLTPSFDRWSTTNTAYASDITNRITSGSGGAVRTLTSTSDVLLSTTTAATNIRQISVGFAISGFGPGEQLDSIKFDGIAVPAN